MSVSASKRVKYAAGIGASLVAVVQAFISLSGAATTEPRAAASADRLMTARNGACAVYLQSGSILITGGQAVKNTLATTEVFNVRTGTTAGATMVAARSGHACAALPNGSILVAGGTGANGAALNSAEIYDPSTASWGSVSAMQKARTGATASLLSTGKILIAGGDNSGVATNTVEIFDPATKTFQTASQTLVTKRTQHAAAALKNGKVLLFGGSDGSNSLDTIESYDPSTGSVSVAGKMSTPRAGLTATLLLDGRVFLAGGSTNGKNEVSSTEIFNPQTGTVIAAASMGAPRRGHLALRLPENNAVLILGGAGNGNLVAAAELYIPWWDKYKPLATLKTPQSSGSGDLTTSIAAALKSAVGGTIVKAATSDPSLFPVLSTDKDDYSPGEVATITGTGWPIGATVSLTLNRDPNHNSVDPTVWTVDVPANNTDGTPNTDGSFTTTYNVTSDDANETLTLLGYVPGTMETAEISRTVVFTDAAQNTTVTASPTGAIGARFSATFTNNGGNSATITNTATGANAAKFGTKSGTPVTITAVDSTFVNSVGEAYAYTGSAVPFSVTTPADGSDLTITLAYTLTGTPRLAFTNAAFTVNANQCFSIAIQSIAGDGQPFNNPANALTVSLSTTSGTGRFYASGSNCGTLLSATSTATASISKGASTVTIGYKDSLATGATLTASSTGFTSGTQIETSPATSTTVTSSKNPSTYNDSVTFRAAVTSGGNSVTTGGVTFIEGGTCATPTITLAGPTVVDGNGQASFTKSDLSAGNHTIVACYGGSGGFTASSGSLIQAVNKATPVITWSNPADISYGTLLSPTQLNATADVAGSFAYTPVAGTKLNAGAGQSLKADFTPTDTANYNTASKTVTINVLKATPVITWANPADITYGTQLGATQLNATADVAGTFTYTPAAGTKLNAGAGQNLKADFTPTDTANYNTASKTVTINVLKATPVITWANPADITYGTQLGATQFNATTDVAGSFAYTPAAGTKLNAGAGQSIQVDFTPTDTANYNTASKTVTINVLKATPVITWANPADISYGTLLSATQLNATSDVAGSFAYTPAAGTKLNAGAGQSLKADFTPTDSGNYNTASKTVTINVLKATPVITWANPADVTYGTQLGATQLNATADVAGTFTYTPAAGAVLSAGIQSLKADFTPTDATNYNAVAKVVSITVNKATPVITWANPAGITYGTPLSAAQLNAAADVPGTFAYTPAAGVVLNAGLGQVLQVLFTPTDAVNYTTATKSVTISVSRAVATISLGGLSQKYDGSPKTATATTNPAGLNVALTYTQGSASVPSPTNVGDYSVTASVDNPNYDGSTTGTLQIYNTETGSNQSVQAWETAAQAVSALTLTYDNVTAAGITSVVRTNIGNPPISGTYQLGISPNYYSIATTATYTASVKVCYGYQNGQFTKPANLRILQLNPPLTWVPLTSAVDINNRQVCATMQSPSTFGQSPVTFAIAEDTSTAITLSGSTSTTYGDPATFSATVIPADAPGNVTFYDGVTLIGAQQPLINGAASLHISTLNSGPHNITAKFVASDSYYSNSDSNTVVLQVGKATPTITWNNPADITYGITLSATQLNATADVAGTFVYTPAAGTKLNAGAAQSLKVDFTPTDSANYNTASKTVTINVLKATPAITWSTPADITYGTALSATQLNATADVTGAFVYTPAAGTKLNAGAGQTLKVDFTPTDTANYNTAYKTVTINVLKATPVITWSNPADITYGTLLSGTQLNATADVAGTFTYAPPAGTKLNAGAGQNLKVDFTPTDTANYNAAYRTVTINVLKATPVITWANPADITYGTLLSGTQLNATADVAGTFAYTPAAGTKLNAGTGQTLSVFFTPTDATNYNTASKTVSINVLKATPIITWANPADITYGTLLSGTQLNAIADVPGTFAYTPAAGTKLNAGAGQNLKVDFTPTDTANYNTAYRTVTINVLKATPVITWANPADITYGTLLSGTQLNATADVAGTFTYAPPAGTKLNAGAGQNLKVDFTPTDTANYNTAYRTVTINVLKATPVITWANPADITYGTLLSVAQLNATSDVAGSFAYTPDTGTKLNAGNGQTLSAVFTPTDSTNYNTASKTVPINVLRATPVITWSNPADITYGTLLSGTQLNATADVAGTFAYTPAAGTKPNAGSNQSLKVDFTPTDGANYNTASKTVYINVLKATPPITWSNPADVTYGTLLSGTQLNATADVAGTFAYTPAAGTKPNAGSNQSLKVDFTPTDGANYNTASKTVYINVLKATPTITWSNPADITYGTQLSATQLNATTTVPGTLLYTPAAGAVLNAGSNQSLKVDFTPADPSNYNTVSKMVYINVAPAATSTTLTSTLSSNTYPVSVTVKAHIAANAIGLAGTVTFTDNGQMVGTPQQIAASGDATVSLPDATSLGVGPHAIVASFTPSNNNFIGSVSSGNAAPDLTITAPTSGSTAAVNTTLSFAATVNDNTTASPSAQWTFDKKATSGAVTSSGVTGSATLTTIGVYQLGLVFNDGLGGIHIANTVTAANAPAGLPAMFVVYDPNAGFVTGGGWITSQPTACTGVVLNCSASATGKANFGFVAKYQKGATKPSGETEFQFKAGGLNFNSTSYDWLLVSGAMAQYKGIGTIAGQTGTFNFMLTARDGDLQANKAKDGIRVKITDASGAVVYDNMIPINGGADDTNSPGNTQDLEGGSIQIQSK